MSSFSVFDFDRRLVACNIDGDINTFRYSGEDFFFSSENEVIPKGSYSIPKLLNFLCVSSSLTSRSAM